MELFVLSTQSGPQRREYTSNISEARIDPATKGANESGCDARGEGTPVEHFVSFHTHPINNQAHRGAHPLDKASRTP